MTECNPIELSQRLRRVEETAREWQDRWRELANPEDTPLRSFRSLLSKEYFEEVGEALSEHDPMRAPLLRWLAHLTEQRVNQLSYVQCAQLRYHELRPLDVPPRTPTTVHQAVYRLVQDRRDAPWLEHLVQHAQKLSAAETLLWQRRVEVARRLGYADSDAFELPSPSVYDLAEWVFDATDALFKQSVEEALAPSSPQRLRELIALGRQPVPLTFPAHLNPRAIASWFQETPLLQDVRLKPLRWPEPLAGSSFALALDRFGHQLSVALAPHSQPFVIATDPLELDAHALGWLFASLLGNAAFQKRHLEATTATQNDVRRALARLGLLELRLRAFKVLLRRLIVSDNRHRDRELEQLSVRWCGAPLSTRLLAVLPRLHASDPQRLCAIGMGTLRAATLTETHNDDWFRNPRAVDQLRAEADLPPNVLVDDAVVKEGLASYVRQLEQHLQ